MAQRSDEEIAQLTAFCEACRYTKLKDLTSESVVVVLEDQNKSGLRCQYTLLIGVDYPDGTVVCKEGGDVATMSGSVLGVVKSLITEWCREHGLELPSDMDNHTDTHQLCSQVSVTSSEYSEASYDDEDFDAYDGYETEDTIHPLIDTEIERVQQLFGHNSIESRIHAGIDEMDIFFNIDLNNFMDEHTALAWGVKLTEPLVILLHVRTVSKYLNGVEPLVDVFQSSTSSKVDRRKVAIGNQLRKIIETFVTERWKSLCNADIESNLRDIESSIGDPDLSSACAELATPGLSHVTGIARQNSLGAQMRAADDIEDDDPMAVKKLPGLEDGFLVQCLQYGLNRIRTLNEFCVICDERHVIETGLIKPCVCTRELCVFAFQTLGVMADAAEAIATDGDVVDLLIAMANAAATSSRAKIIFDPFPSIIHPDKPDKLVLDPKAPDYDLVRNVLSEVVRTREDMLAGRATRGVKEELDSHHKVAFPLMQWIIATCRAHIVLLPEDRRLPSIKTPYQFLLISSPPAKEAAFQTAKAKFGSTFAFHGSNIENWHSIVRTGLINASGTKLQLHGAAYGSGIYLSPKASVSFGYMGYRHVAAKPRPPGTKDSLVSKVNLKCLALCEVVKSKDLKKSGDIWVCPQSDNVCTRFFLVFDYEANSGQDRLEGMDTQNQKFGQQINHAIAHINRFRANKTTIKSKSKKK